MQCLEPQHCPVPPTAQLCQHESSSPPVCRVPPTAPNPSQPHRAPPHPIAKQLPSVQGTVLIQVWIRGEVIPRVTPVKPLPKSLSGWKPSLRATQALLTSHTAHLLIFSPPAPCVPWPACPCPRAMAHGLGDGKSRPHLSVGLLPIFPGAFYKSRSCHMKKFKLVCQRKQE